MWRAGRKTDEFKPVCIVMLSHKLDDGLVLHPLGYHRKLILGHYYPYKVQDVWMQKSPPYRKLLAESL